jgi:hypothetical protein
LRTDPKPCADQRPYSNDGENPRQRQLDYSAWDDAGSPQRSRLIRWDSGFQGEPARKGKAPNRARPPQGENLTSLAMLPNIYMNQNLDTEKLFTPTPPLSLSRGNLGRFRQAPKPLSVPHGDDAQLALRPFQSPLCDTITIGGILNLGHRHGAVREDVGQKFLCLIAGRRRFG